MGGGRSQFFFSALRASFFSPQIRGGEGRGDRGGASPGSATALYRIAFAPTRKSYPMGLLFTRKNGDFSAISETERSCAAPISNVESHISDG